MKAIVFPLLSLLMLFFAGANHAQSYDVAAGIRLGTDWGVSGKYRFAKRTTGELIFQSSLQREEVLLTLLAEQHSPLITRRLNFYAGGGIHKGWINEVNGEQPFKDPFGLTLIAGAEVTLGRLNLTYDFKPAINISGGEKRMYSQTGITLRYVFVKRKWLQGNRRRKRNSNGFNWRFWEKKD